VVRSRLAVSPPAVVTLLDASIDRFSWSTSRETSREAPDWVCVCRLPVAPLSVLVAEPEPEAEPPRPCHDAVFPERLTLPRLAAETDPLERLARRWA